MPAIPRQVYALTLRKVHAFMLARGARTDELLAGTEISATDLEDPYRLIHRQQALSYYRNVVQLADSPGIGLEIGWLTGLSDAGPQGLSSVTARTVREAVSLAYPNRHLYDLLCDWRLEITGDRVSHFVRVDVDNLEEPLRVFLLERGLGTLQAHTEELVGPEAAPVEVSLDYAAPSNFRRYEEIFRCPVFFRRTTTVMHYPAGYLDIAVPTHDPQVNSIMDVLRDSMLRKLRSNSDVVRDVKLLLLQKAGEFPDLEMVARSLAMSSRTLRRKLGQHDVTFQQLLDAARREVAEDYLGTTNMSIQQVAERCGFQDAQSFSQAFKRWLGISPSQYRRARNANRKRPVRTH